MKHVEKQFPFAPEGNGYPDPEIPLYPDSAEFFSLHGSPGYFQSTRDRSGNVALKILCIFHSHA
jgi:hypothetical protein